MRAHAEKIARENPRAEVLQVTHDRRHEPWSADRVAAVCETILSRSVSDFDPKDHDFTVRRTLLDDPEILAFKKCHPKLFQTVTDRTLMKDPKYRGTIQSLLDVRRRVETGELPENGVADAAATQAVVTALGTTPPARAASAPSMSDLPSQENNLRHDGTLPASKPAVDEEAAGAAGTHVAVHQNSVQDSIREDLEE